MLATQRLIEATQARVDELIEADRTAEQETELQSLEGRIAGLRATYATLLSFSSGSATNLLTVLEPAIESSSPVSPRPLVNVLLAVIISVLVIAAIAFLTEQLDESIKDPEAVYQILGLSTLGTIGRMTAGRGEEFQSLAGLTHPRSSYAEAYRTLRSNIDFSSVDEPLKSILVTSAAPAEGKTVTAANLAVVFAQAGRPVLLVDADLRKPGLHRMFKLPNAEGLTTLMRGEAVSLASQAPDGGAQSVRPDDGSTSTQPGRAAGLTEDATRHGSVPQGGISRHHRQSADRCRHRRRRAEFICRRDTPHRRCISQQTARCQARDGDVGEGRGEYARGRPQPGSGRFRIVLRGLPHRRSLPQGHRGKRDEAGEEAAGGSTP